MKPLRQAILDDRIKEASFLNEDFAMGRLRLSCTKRLFSFMASIDREPGGGTAWEHVSISLMKNGTDCPSWEEMCETKSLFWNDDEEVHQIHPKAGEYLHAVQNKANILHLWRPAGGWKI